MTPSTNARRDPLYDWLDAAAEGALTPDEWAALEARLLADPAARRTWLLANGAFALLERFSPLNRDQVEPTPQPAPQRESLAPAPQPTPLDPATPPDFARPAVWRRAFSYISQPLQFSVLVATVTTISAMLSLAQFPAPQDLAESAVVGDEDPLATLAHARLTRQDHCRWVKDAGPRPGGTLPSRTPLRLRQGAASFALPSGAEVTVYGPAHFVLDSLDRMRLQSGRMTARVPALAHGFTVQTPLVNVVDLGTEFGVAADSAGETEVHVFSGEVELSPASPQHHFAPRRCVAGAGAA